MTTSFNPAGQTPATPDPVNASSNQTQPTGFDFEYAGRKFTREELLTKLTHADTHIATLTSERHQDREALTKANEALANAIKAAELLKAPAAAPAAPVVAPAIDPAQIQELALKAVEARETQVKEQANWEAAVADMTRVYGDQADAKAKEMAAAVGMTFEDVVQMARQKPLAFRRLFPELGTSAAPAVAPTPGRSFNTSVDNTPSAKPKSGYWESKSSKEQVVAYTKRLQELSGA